MTLFQEWSQQIKSYNRNIKLSIIANVFAQIGLGMFMVIYNFYIRELGYLDHVNGQVISMTSLATAIIIIPAGLLSDRFGRKKAMFFGVVLSGAFLMLRSIVEPQSLLIFFAFMTGLTSAFLQVSSIPWLAENSKPEQRVHLFSIHFAVMTASNVVGSLLGGVLTDVFSISFNGLLSVRFTLLVGAVIFLLSVIPISKLHEIRERDKKTSEKIPFVERVKLQGSSLKIIMMFAVAQLIIGIGAGLVIPYLNLYFADRFAASNSAIGFIISLGQAATAFAMFIGPMVVKKLGEVKAVVFLQLMSLPFLLLTAYTDNLILAAVGFLFRQALMNAGNPIQTSLIMSKVDNSMRGFANSVNSMVFNLGWAFMGPVSTGIVVVYGAYWGYALVFTITAGLYLVGSIYFLFMFRSVNRLQPIASTANIDQ